MEFKANCNGNNVLTGKVLFNYVHLLEPYAPKNGNGEAVYSACLVIPKSDKATIDAINQAVDNTLKAQADRFGGKVPNRARLHLPLRDGDVEREDNEDYKDSYFINVKSKNKPPVVDRNKKDLETDDQVYSGMYGRAYLNFYAYSNAGNAGVSCGIGGVQKLEDGMRRGGGKMSVNSMFGDLDGSEDNGLPF